ncbi:MAG TPA: ABC transporter ATP-binding protein [Flavobacteriales bacterium]|nr:ABC transporter ATP-binding protein [Flavobacteriales bacterium]HMR27280.1 ABC transporter ATP-binding protein [Flavobacteriales bacterium]
MDVISTTALTKRYGTVTAVDRISLRVGEGEIHGFLGLNGAGKTTLIRMLLGMVRPTDGAVHLFGKPVNKAFDRWNNVGYLVETPFAYPGLSVYDNLWVFQELRRLKGRNVIDAVIDRLHLGRYKHQKAGQLSLGNRHRLGLAKALMHKPRLLILDEPINGLDPEGIVEVRLLLKELAAQGSTIFLSSHIIGELAKVSMRLSIIHEGRLVTELDSSEIAARLGQRLVLSTLDNAAAMERLARHGVQAQLHREGYIALSDPDSVRHPERIAALLVQEGLPPTLLQVRSEDLEELFLRVIHPPPQRATA